MDCYALWLGNTPSSFIRLMNEVLHPFINYFVVVYLDDILIYWQTKKLHFKHLKQVFKALHAQHLSMVRWKSVCFLFQVLFSWGTLCLVMV